MQRSWDEFLEQCEPYQRIKARADAYHAYEAVKRAALGEISEYKAQEEARKARERDDFLLSLVGL